MIPLFRISGRKEVTEAVVIAALTSLFTGLIDYVIRRHEASEERKRKRVRKKPAK